MAVSYSRVVAICPRVHAIFFPKSFACTCDLYFACTCDPPTSSWVAVGLICGCGSFASEPWNSAVRLQNKVNLLARMGIQGTTILGTDAHGSRLKIQWARNVSIFSTAPAHVLAPNFDSYPDHFPRNKQNGPSWGSDFSVHSQHILVYSVLWLEGAEKTVIFFRKNKVQISKGCRHNQN